MAQVDEVEPPTRWQWRMALLVAAFVILYTASCLFTQAYDAMFFAIPLFVGFISGTLAPRSAFWAALYALLVSLVLSLLVRAEGVICLFFSLPILLPMLWLGAFAGSVVRRRVHTERARRRNAWLALLLGVGGQAWSGYTDDPAQHPVHHAETQIAIAAPPVAVFAALTERELRVASRWQWFLRIGLPMPERMRVEQPGVGGHIRFDFSQGAAFAHITQWQPGRALSYQIDGYDIHDLPFHITRLGRAPSYGFRSERVGDWLTLLTTEFTLTPTADGGTVLVRRCAWRRHLAPAFYFGWLQQTVMERGQKRLLDLIRQRVLEAGATERVAAR